MALRVLIIDNYDSFVYNLYQYLGELGAEPTVLRNDTSSLPTLRALEPDAVVISPGPGRPHEAGVSCEAIASFAEAGIPVLGVCLGHQCIGEVYGASIIRADVIVHGRASPVTHDGQGVFAGLANPLEATRYHSLVIDPATMPAVLEVSARTSDGHIMGVRHRSLPVEGVQFHPESILTGAQGRRLLANFLAMAGDGPTSPSSPSFPSSSSLS